MKLISWNMGRRPEAWRTLLDTDADVALLQAAVAPPPEIASRIEVDAEPWSTAGVEAPGRTAVVRLTDNVRLDWLKPGRLKPGRLKPGHLGHPDSGRLVVSCPGTLAAARVLEPDAMACVIVSLYGFWEKSHISTGSGSMYPDASVHRLISDLSALIGEQGRHRIIAAGDLNILYGYAEQGSAYWAARFATVFDRMAALEMAFVGPQAPAGRRAEPWPDDLPRASNNVPTFYAHDETPATATRQLDYVFASQAMADRVHVRALNEPEQWGPSDHCRIEIELTTAG